MPIYEYQCEACDHVFEKLVLNGKVPETCPECSAERLERLISNTSFKLKGSGWYETDYGSSNSSNDSSASTSEADEASDDAGETEAASGDASSTETSTAEANA